MSGLILCFPVLLSAAGTLTISGSITLNHSEQDVIDGNQEIILNLTDGATWIAAVADSLADWQLVFSSSGSWGEISSLLSLASLERTNDTVFTITLPASAAYAIWADETVTITVPDELLATGSALNTSAFTITDEAPVISIYSGSTLLTNNDESDILAGLETIIIDVSRDNWNTLLGSDIPITNAFIDGITGNGKWTEVMDLLAVANIDRASDTRVTITLPAAAGYVITADETVTFEFPGSSYLNATVPATTNPTLTINDLSPVVTISGTATPAIGEYSIRAGTNTVIFDVQYDTWLNRLGNNNDTTTSFLNGITGNRDWGTVAAQLGFGDLARNSDTRVTLSLPAVSLYAISTNETVSSSIPAAAFTGSSGAAPGNLFTVNNQNAATSVTWSTGTSTITEAQVRTGGLTLTLDLSTSDSWSSDLAVLKAQFITGLNAGAGSEWNTKVLPNISVARPSSTRAVITFAAAVTFDISSTLSITYAIPDGALQASSGALITAATSGFSINPSAAGAGISPVSINEADLDGAAIDLIVSEEVFSTPALVDASYFTLSAPAGVTISSVTNKTSSGVRLNLAYSGNIDVNATLQVTVINGLSAGGSLVSNTSTIVAVVEPVVTNVTIPNQAHNIGDVVPVTITVDNDNGQVFSLTSGTVGGRLLTGLTRTNSTTYSAAITIVGGTTDYPALSNIPVSVQLEVSGRSGNLFTSSIIQNSDLIDANPPAINSFQALGTMHKAGDFVQLIATCDQAGYSVNNALTSINGISITSPAFELVSESGGSYFFTYQISGSDNDVLTSAALTGQIAFNDAAGNVSLVKSVVAVSPSFSIDAHAPAISLVSAPDSTYIPGETILVAITADGNGYTLSPETFINGISFSSGRFTLNGTGPAYTLHYPVQNSDAEVTPGNLPLNIVLKDAAGNKSIPVTSFANNLAIYTAKPTATTTGSGSICKGDSVTVFVNLTGRPNWNLVVWDGSKNLIFNQIPSSPFSFKVSPQSSATYTVLSVTDNSGLSNTGTGAAAITVNSGTAVSINSLGSAYSVESLGVILSATPSGGVFSGPGVIAAQNKFYPEYAGVPDSPHTILYSYTNGFGCVSKDSAIVSVIEASGGISAEDLYCYNAEPFTAFAFTDPPNIPGVFELRLNGTLIPNGNGIHDNGDNSVTISPKLLIPGNNYLLTFVYYFNEYLQLNKNFFIEYIEPPKFLGLPDPADICENASSINLAGNAANGYFTGIGVSGSSTSGFKFDPAIAGSGAITITYADSTINGCKNQSLAEITVNAITPVKINSLSSEYNLLRPYVELSATLLGGVFNGPGVESTSSKFYPGIAGVPNSPHKLIYTYANAFGCVSKDSTLIGVKEAEGSILLGDVYCYNAEAFVARAIPNSPSILGRFELINETLDIPVVSGILDNGDNTAVISPPELAPGDYQLVYRYFQNDTFSIQKGFSIETIKQPKFIGFPNPAEKCENDEPFNLAGDAANGYFLGIGVTGNSVNGFRFDPSVSGHGQHLITYFDSTANGCKISATQGITVFFLPSLSFTASDSCIVSSDLGSVIHFTNTTAAIDSVKTWNWDFNDVNSGENNFSTDKSASHSFKNAGRYTIVLKDTTHRGCAGRHEVNFEFGEKPSGTFKVLNECFSPGTPTDFSTDVTSKDGISFYNWKIHLPGGIVIDTTITGKNFSYLFDSEGKYDIEHGAVSLTKCRLDLADSIILKPTLIMQHGTPYIESFDATEGGWSRSRVNDNSIPGLSWTWGLPEFDALSEDGRKAWHTKRANSSVRELSYVISPCFNLSALERPMIKMDIFRNFGSFQDATLLQSSVDNGEVWNTLGNPGDGINWYSNYQTANYAFGSNYGWANETGTIADSGWVESRHILDPVAGSTNVQFRIVFGTKESTVSDYEGFAFSNFSISERERFSVLEHFANTTPLNPVKDKVKSANLKVNALYNKEYMHQDFIKLEYHTRFPSEKDSLNIFNRDVPGARAYYYGVTSVPYSLLDGGDRTGRRFDFTDTKFEPKEVDINLRSLEDPAFEIDIETSLAGDNLSIDIDITALENLPASERVLYVLLYETFVTGYNAENGETKFQNVVRDILPIAGGTPIYHAFSSEPGNVTHLEYSFTADLSKLDTDKIRVAAYLQDDFSGEIYQAALSDYSRSVGTGISGNTVYGTRISAYPNPATDFVEIMISGTLGPDSRLEFFDQLGRKIHFEEIGNSENSRVISTTGFNKGIYFIRLTERGMQKSEVVKLVILK